jgi:hypothetical protein
MNKRDFLQKDLHNYDPIFILLVGVDMVSKLVFSFYVGILHMEAKDTYVQQHVTLYTCSWILALIPLK